MPAAEKKIRIDKMRKFLLLLITLILSSVFALFSVACGCSGDDKKITETLLTKRTVKRKLPATKDLTLSWTKLRVL